MGNVFIRYNYKLSTDEIREIKKKTGFSQAQVERLFKRFHALDKEGKGYITRYELHHLNEIILNPVGDKIVEKFFEDSDKCKFENFALVFSVFKPTKHSDPSYVRHSREGKLKFLYSLIDTNGDGHLEREEVFDLLEQMMGSKVDEEQLRLIADRIIQEADTTGTGTITFSEFKEATSGLDLEGVMSFVALR